MITNSWLINNDDYVIPSIYASQVLIYFIIWCLSYKWYNDLVKKHNLLIKIPLEKHLEAKTRVISSLHAVILSFFSFCYLSGILNFESWTICLPISGGFGLFDLTMITLNYNKFKKGYFATSTHHLCLIFGPLTTTYNSSILISQAYLFETTVPILDVAWYLYNANKRNSFIFKFTSIISVLLFLVFRVFNSAYLTYSVINGNIAITFFSSYFFALNIYWFKKLVNVFLKELKNV